jgi:hypothetical protein
MFSVLHPPHRINSFPVLQLAIPARVLSARAIVSTMDEIRRSAAPPDHLMQWLTLPASRNRINSPPVGEGKLEACKSFRFTVLHPSKLLPRWGVAPGNITILFTFFVFPSHKINKMIWAAPGHNAGPNAVSPHYCGPNGQVQQSAGCWQHHLRFRVFFAC